ncbi:hypothetical protein N7517_005857 [Penicillium concentricum]|uniref:Uncharacterized protein n=1 Tax=Penicillium concentricum TaxID=293559 RepID=A0A9W9S857_9EURO|nr:uncharacterized protein N7517_005857 [Penicillium concentricum]KAJ5373851.1 hypothetical protein N7517_005857 [Penicillium concentricum]
MSFNPGYTGHQGSSSDQFYVNQQSYVNQPSYVYPQGDFYDQGVNFLPPTTFADHDNDETSNDGWNHGTISQPGMIQQPGVSNQGFVPQEVLAFEQDNVHQQASKEYHQGSSYQEELMALERSNNRQGNFHQLANMHDGAYLPEPAAMQQLNIHHGNVNQQANMYHGLYPQEPLVMQQFNNDQGDFHQQASIQQGFCVQEPMTLEQLNNQQDNFHHQGGLYQQGININSQDEVYNHQRKLAYQAHSPNAYSGAISKTEAIHGTKGKHQATQKAPRKLLDNTLDIDTILSSNNKLLMEAADFQLASLLNSAKDHKGRLTDDNRNLELDWIMGALKLNLTYLEARRRRAEANKKNRR